jgi:hypothetical protein
VPPRASTYRACSGAAKRYRWAALNPKRPCRTVVKRQTFNLKLDILRNFLYPYIDILDNKAKVIPMKNDIKAIVSSDLKVGNRSKFRCNNCKTETIQRLAATHRTTHYSGDYDPNSLWENGAPYFEECEYRLWICEGCETACLQNARLADELSTIGDEIHASIFYPYRDLPIEKNIVPKEYNHIPEKIEHAYKEAVTAYNTNLPVACAIILRALLEAICIEKGITDDIAWNLIKKIEQLKIKNILSDNIVDNLHAFKFMGDDAAHSLEKADRADLELAIKIMEDIFNLLYEVNYRLSQNTQSLANSRTIELREQAKQRGKKKKL